MDNIPFDRFNENTPIIVDGIKTYGLWNPPPFLDPSYKIPDDQISTFYVDSSTEGRPDIIASIVYGSSYLDWVIIYFNNVINPLNWPKAGTTVLYPSNALVAKFIT